MTASNIFAYDRGGSVIVVADGKEVLSHSGADESPLWRASCDDLVVAIGSTSDTVFAVDAAGRLSRWGAKDGQPGQSVDLGATPKGLAVAPNGACAVVLADAVAIVARGILARKIAIPGATAAALTDDGGKLAVGSGDGTLRLFSINGDGGGDEPIAKLSVGEAVRNIAWNPGSFWLLTGGDRVFRAEGDLGSIQQVTRATGMTPDCIACSEDGMLFALRLDASTVVALGYPSRDTVATIQYIDKKVVGVAFGPVPFIGVGLSGGDANKINLRTEGVHRTDTHPGRTHNRWMLSCAIEGKALPPAYASAAKATSALRPRAGYPDDELSTAKPSPGGGGLSVTTIVGLAFVALGLAILLITRC